MMGIELEDVKYVKTDNMILVTSRPAPSPEQLKQGFTQALELSENTNCGNILFDGTNIHTLPSINKIWPISMELLKRIKLIFSLRVAYVLSDEVNSPFEFFEDYLANSGIPIQKFDNIKEATIWLQSIDN